MRNFIGTHDHKLDDKGRVSLPTEFRRVLAAVGSADGLYVVPQLQDLRAHVVFTIDGYEAMIARHDATEYPSPERRQRADLMLITRASQVQVDDNGRVVISRPLREQIELQKEIRFVGSGSTFQIWRPDAREAFEAELMAADEGPLDFDLRGLHG